MFPSHWRLKFETFASHFVYCQIKWESSKLLALLTRTNPAFLYALSENCNQNRIQLFEISFDKPSLKRRKLVTVIAFNCENEQTFFSLHFHRNVGNPHAGLRLNSLHVRQPTWKLVEKARRSIIAECPRRQDQWGKMIIRMNSEIAQFSVHLTTAMLQSFAYLLFHGESLQVQWRMKVERRPGKSRNLTPKFSELEENSVNADFSSFVMAVSTVNI